MEQFPVGKIPHNYFISLLRRNAIDDPRVVIGPAHGEDAAVIDLGGQSFLIAKTDPITFATDEIGWYAVNVNANDIAASGGKPAFFMATVLLPEFGTTGPMIENIFDQIISACGELGVSLVGGHTEVTYGLDRPLVVGVMLGLAPKSSLTLTGGARSGDHLLLTKGFPIEATSIIAREKRETLLKRFPDSFLDVCAGALHDPGISVVKDARIALSVGGVHAMHDPTEGGIATGLWEMAEASGKELTVSLDQALCVDGAKICGAVGVNPLGAIASGSLLLAVDPGKSTAIIAALAAEDIACFRIGLVNAGEASVVLENSGEILFRPEQDEITRLFT